MIYTFLGLSLLFAFIGFIITPNNAKYILNGYKELSEEERKKVDLIAFLKFHKNFHVIFAVLFLLGGWLSLEFFGDMMAGTLLAVFPLVSYVFYILKLPAYFPDTSKNYIFATLIILFITLLMLSVLLWYGNQESKIERNEKYVEISGMHGEFIPLHEIQSLHLVDSLPKIVMKSNGYSLGEVKKGYFKTADGQKIKLILNQASPPYLLIVKKSGDSLYFSGKETATEEVFKQICPKEFRDL